MHEAGIAQSIIDIAETVARERAGAPILKIHLKLGAFTGVVREALEFAFEALKSDTLASHATLEIETIPLIGACPACGWTGPPEEDYCLVCPRCGTPATIVSGREMQVEWVELDDSKGETIDGTSHGRDQSPEPERPVCRSQPAAV
jgi:hydrogenase nickel incorporation protein HypA/HybF